MNGYNTYYHLAIKQIIALDDLNSAGYSNQEEYNAVYQSFLSNLE